MSINMMIMIAVVDCREKKHTHARTLTHTHTHTHTHKWLGNKTTTKQKRYKVPMGLTLFSWMLRSAPAATRACTHFTLPLPAASIRAV